MIWANFDFLAPTVLYRRDKVGNFGQFDDKTLFGKESNLHTKRAFTNNILRWTHNARTVVSLFAIEWSTHSVFIALAGKKVEIWRPKKRVLMRDPANLISLRSSPLCRHLECGQLSPHGWRDRNFWSCKLPYASHVCRSGRMITSAGQENFCFGYCLFYANLAKAQCSVTIHKNQTWLISI